MKQLEHQRRPPEQERLHILFNRQISMRHQHVDNDHPQGLVLPRRRVHMLSSDSKRITTPEPRTSNRELLARKTRELCNAVLLRQMVDLRVKKELACLALRIVCALGVASLTGELVAVVLTRHTGDATGMMNAQSLVTTSQRAAGMWKPWLELTASSISPM